MRIWKRNSRSDLQLDPYLAKSIRQHKLLDAFDSPKQMGRRSSVALFVDTSYHPIFLDQSTNSAFQAHNLFNRETMIPQIEKPFPIVIA